MFDLSDCWFSFPISVSLRCCVFLSDLSLASTLHVRYHIVRHCRKSFAKSLYEFHNKTKILYTSSVTVILIFVLTTDIQLSQSRWTHTTFISKVHYQSSQERGEIIAAQNLRCHLEHFLCKPRRNISLTHSAHIHSCLASYSFAVPHQHVLKRLFFRVIVHSVSLNNSLEGGHRSSESKGASISASHELQYLSDMWPSVMPSVGPYPGK